MTRVVSGTKIADHRRESPYFASASAATMITGRAALAATAGLKPCVTATTEGAGAAWGDGTKQIRRPHTHRHAHSAVRMSPPLPERWVIIPAGGSTGDLLDERVLFP